MFTCMVISQCLCHTPQLCVCKFVLLSVCICKAVSGCMVDCLQVCTYHVYVRVCTLMSVHACVCVHS